MVTRLQTGSLKSKAILNLLAISTEPSSYLQALRIFEWRFAMQIEFAALQQQQTWELVPTPAHQKVIGCK